MPRFTDEQRQAVFQKINERATDKEVSEALGISYQAARNARKSKWLADMDDGSISEFIKEAPKPKVETVPSPSPQPVEIVDVDDADSEDESEEEETELSDIYDFNYDDFDDEEDEEDEDAEEDEDLELEEKLNREAELSPEELELSPEDLEQEVLNAMPRYLDDDGNESEIEPSGFNNNPGVKRDSIFNL